MHDAVDARDGAFDLSPVGEVGRDEICIGLKARRRPDIGEPQPVGVLQERRQPRAHVARRAGDQYFLHRVISRIRWVSKAGPPGPI